jgi:hypothetical protein
MVAAQGGTCAVCPGASEHVDHDHATGRVRGVLCFLCNQAFGNTRDDVVVLHGLITYLERHRPRPRIDRLDVRRRRVEVDLPDRQAA